jgi:hypothetical protein
MKASYLDVRHKPQAHLSSQSYFLNGLKFNLQYVCVAFPMVLSSCSLYKNHKIDRLGRFKIPQIHSPVFLSYSKSTSIFSPAACKANATFSVQTFPTGFIE